MNIQNLYFLLSYMVFFLSCATTLVPVKDKMPDDAFKKKFGVFQTECAFAADAGQFGDLKKRLREGIQNNADLTADERAEILKRIDAIAFAPKKILFFRLKSRQPLKPDVFSLTYQFPGWKKPDLLKQLYSASHRVTVKSEYGTLAYWVYTDVLEFKKPAINVNHMEEKLPLRMIVGNAVGLEREYLLLDKKK